MKGFDRRVICLSAALVAAAAVGVAQDRPAPPGPATNPNMNDPRVGLKPGFKDAGQAARNMELVASLGKPNGFFDPSNPSGAPTPAAPGARGAAPPAGAQAGAGAAAGGAAPAGRGRGPSGLDFANSDIAFQRADLFLGNFNGFNTYDIETPKKPRLLSSVVCPGGQGDMSVYGHLLFMSVEQTRGRVDCGTQGVTDAVSAERFRGVRIFDISDIQHP
jgi:hypothetical protein